MAAAKHHMAQITFARVENESAPVRPGTGPRSDGGLDPTQTVVT